MTVGGQGIGMSGKSMTRRQRGARLRRWLRVRVVLAVLGVVAGLGAVGSAPAAWAADPCADPMSIACENLKPGTPDTVWDINGDGSSALQGFATDMSVNRGQTIGFKVSTTKASFDIAVYRLGWYQGNGARLVATIPASATTAKNQTCTPMDPQTSLVDCGNWDLSASWQVPSTAVSGVYVAQLRAPDGSDSHIVFVVRDDSRHSDMLFQTSDTTWQAYNDYGGASLYGGPNGRATKISYNRPFSTRGGISARDFLFANEYPMIRFLERNGYDVTYLSGVDSDRFGTQLLNHKVFLSVGHDEYWSGTQRANVEAARDSGVNLAFFSGNEVYWKTRWESSTFGSGPAAPGPTSHRTLVCYKETKDNAKSDPSPEWTGTWRDPRFSPPADGGRPENALTGTAYMSNFTDLAIKVSAEEGKLRFWRGTSAAALAPGASETLSEHSVGYESNEDLDNGFRPAGQIRLSTTTGPVPEYLQDYGSTVAPGTTTHHLTLHRAGSGALVFGAGTIQWPWGLDDQHDGATTATNRTMQQATVNLFADMGVQPQTLMATLSVATASQDATAPTVTVTSPAAGAQVANGTLVTATGTASDVGGRVGGVEVSTDGGQSWHPASGTTSWSYSFVQQGNGPVSIKVRASDDSLNLSAPVRIGYAAACPCSLFGQAVPKIVDSGDASPVELGVRVVPSITGWITGVRFYKAAANTGTHSGRLWSNDGTLLAEGVFAGETASGWQTMTFAAPVPVTGGTTYVASYTAAVGHYSLTADLFTRTPYVAPPLTSPVATATAGNGVFAPPGQFPDRSYGAPSYGVDVVFSDIDTVAPTVLASTPVAGASSVPVDTHPQVVFGEDVVPASVSLTLAPAGGSAVSGTVDYQTGTRTATFTPAQQLSRDTPYVLTASATDLAGNAMTGTAVAFRTAAPDQVPGACPCLVWDDSTVPGTRAYPDLSANELGMRFSTVVDGHITGVRFYKGVGNSGTHTGSLWTADGTRLATATFTNESTEGWQSVTFATPVPVTAGQTYLVSYFGPAGRYSLDIGGLENGISRHPLVVPGPGGAYRVGSTGFPSSTANENYWVQPVFTVPATTKPTVRAMSPSAGTTNAWVDQPVRVTFDSPVQPGSAAVAVTGPRGAVSGTTSYDSGNYTVTFTPATPLPAGATLQVGVSGARSLGGAAMDPVTASFTTAGATVCPCTAFPSTATPGVVDVGDGSAVSLGMRFTPTEASQAVGVRFFKSAANTGQHTGSLWSASGQRLATGIFSGESQSGWQTLTFAQPVDLVAGQTYVVSYYAPNGHYSADAGGLATGRTNGIVTTLGAPNGVYTYGGDLFPTSSYASANYWVDPVLLTGAAADLTPPSVVSAGPVAGATSVPVSTTVAVTFSEPVAASSISLRDDAGTSIAGTTSHDAINRTTTFTPNTPLARGMVYTVTPSATDQAGNAMPTVSWTFRTMLPSPTPTVCPCSVWDDTAVPSVLNDPDPADIEVGMQFTVDQPMLGVGLRFYKGVANTGSHVGTLWSPTGQALAQVAVTGESTSGWQSAQFGTPVQLVPGQTYVVSYRALQGHYSATNGGLAAAVDTPPLHVPAGGGRYAYGGGFPTQPSTANYWVDPIVAAPPPPVAAPAITAVTAQPGSGSLTVSWTTDVAATARVDYGTTATGLTQVATGPTGTAHSVTFPVSANTRYYYRVTSAVPATPSASATVPAATDPPAGYEPTPVPVVVDTAAQLATGTVSNVTLTADGSIILRPAYLNELNGTSLGSGLASTVLATGGTTVVAGGNAALNGTRVQRTTTYLSSGSVTWRAAFTGPGQRLGFVGSGSSQLTVGTTTAGQLTLVANGGVGAGVTAAAGPVPAGQHDYRVEWASGTATVYVDGAPVATAPFTPLFSQRVTALDTVVDAVALSVDWVRVGPYTASGTYTSAVADAGATVVWGQATSLTELPNGTTQTLQVRTGSTPTPGTGWTAWATVPSTGALSQAARYLQFRAVMTSTGTGFATPTVGSVTLNYHLQ